uniref:DNA-repair protein Xrcc1 N-terminal domain-containing protein n=1 Tax=Plectus sambesii TaxID=2011161 RepID=A0A914UPP2_9BILA
MPDVKFKHVVSCSSEDPKNPAANLVAQEAFRKWKGVAGQPSVSVILQLEKSTKVRALDIGNEFSAFIEVLVGKSTDTEDAYH